MRVPNHSTLILRMLQHRLKKLATASPILAASFGTYTHRCGKPTCRCHKPNQPRLWCKLRAGAIRTYGLAVFSYAGSSKKPPHLA